MKEEESRCIAAMQAFKVAEKKIQELNTKLTKFVQEKKSVEAALNEVKKQAEAQRKQLCQAKDELATAKNQIKILTRKLKEAEKAKDQAEQDRYEAGMAKTKEALKAEVSEVCRYYYLQVWNETLNQSGVKSSSAFRRTESIYYPPTIRASSFLESQANTASNEANTSKESPAKVLPSVNSPSKEAEQPKVAKKEANTNKEVAHGAIQPPAAPKDPSKEKEASHNMEIVLTTVPMPTKEDLKGKGPTFLTTALAQPIKAPAKDKLVLKNK